MKKAVIVLLKCQVPKPWLAFNVFILSDRDIKEGKYFTHANNKDAEQTVSVSAQSGQRHSYSFDRRYNS